MNSYSVIMLITLFLPHYSLAMDCKPITLACTPISCNSSTEVVLKSCTTEIDASSEIDKPASAKKPINCYPSNRSMNRSLKSSNSYSRTEHARRK